MAFEYIYRRHSVRKFKPDLVPEKDIRAIIEAATHAPSGKNKQNWHFVVVTSQEMVAKIATIVEEKHEMLLAYMKDPVKIQAFKASLLYHTVFRGAPALVLVYAGPYEMVADTLLADGIMPVEQARQYAFPNAGMQNVAAAMQTMLLAAAELGYGTCWMTGPTYAADEISQYVGFAKDGYRLAAITPLGIPLADKNPSPPRKPLDEVLTILP